MQIVYYSIIIGIQFLKNMNQNIMIKNAIYGKS